MRCHCTGLQSRAIAATRLPDLFVRRQQRQRRQPNRRDFASRATRVDIDVDSPQTSDDEAAQPSHELDHHSIDNTGRRSLNDHTVPVHPLHASHHAAEQSHAAAQHSPSAQHQQQHAGHAAQPHSSAAAADNATQLDAAQLFPSRHVPRWTPELIAYFPLGCLIGAARMAMWVALLALDQELLTDNDTAIQVLYRILGVSVTWRGEEHLPAERHVLVSNHVTVGDLMVLYARPSAYVHLITSRLPRRITQARHHRVKLRHASSDTYRQLADSAAHPDPVHLFPEGGMTNGRGMMQFSRGFMRFGKGLPIVPAAVRATLPWGISTHTLGSSFAANMFWFCFAPAVELEVTVLPPMRQREGEGNGSFVQRVQRAIAAELGIPIIDITLQQKHKLQK